MSRRQQASNPRLTELEQALVDAALERLLAEDSVAQHDQDALPVCRCGIQLHDRELTRCPTCVAEQRRGGR